MPAQDILHEVVIRTLVKAGWSILDEQVYISIGTSPENHRRLFIDIKAQLGQRDAVLIEVKALDRSPVHQLMELVGQYLVYRAALDYLNIQSPLYVAISDTSYDNIIQHVLGQQIMDQYLIPLMIFDPVEEMIQQWIPPL